MNETLVDALAVAAGGALGSVGRWAIGLGLASVLPGVPVATFCANVTAGLLIGVINGIAAGAGMPEQLRLLLAMGLCGGLSTFSTFSNETYKLLEAGSVAPALVNIVANVCVCLAAVWLGYRLVAALG